MTQRNFFVNHGLECGDIVISATTNTITGLSTAAPTADGDVANKKYVDDNGVATASNTGSDMVGIALESNGDSGVKLVECILKV